MRSTLVGLRDRGLAPTTVLDVGANRGDWTKLARDIFPAATYVMLEPQLEMAPYLDAVGEPWHGVAAGSENGTLELTIWPDLVGSSFLKPDGADYPTRPVKIVTINHLIARENYAIPELVKLDIQGFELEALRGATQLFGVTEAFIVEVSLFSFGGHPILREVVEFMGERGYETYDIAGALRRPSDGALGNLDLCFARVDGALRESNSW
ncbi:hypothetical protein BST42_17215 [Mycolicibacterium rhodesiae]|uniref:Methyltransferase FkbM domain-containing protein n=1 Tax=Mycolicibacterium rhodesiae TaxID=36814 RepID=A0A1X0IT36_MYCRH|nr:hypothetical protein BST42_17215 [Mycolicibacterium rhodesiae]